MKRDTLTRATEAVFVALCSGALASLAFASGSRESCDAVQLYCGASGAAALICGFLWARRLVSPRFYVVSYGGGRPSVGLWSYWRPYTVRLCDRWNAAAVRDGINLYCEVYRVPPGTARRNVTAVGRRIHPAETPVRTTP